MYQVYILCGPLGSRKLGNMIFHLKRKNKGTYTYSNFIPSSPNLINNVEQLMKHNKIKIKLLYRSFNERIVSGFFFNQEDYLEIIKKFSGNDIEFHCWSGSEKIIKHNLKYKSDKIKQFAETIKYEAPDLLALKLISSGMGDFTKIKIVEHDILPKPPNKLFKEKIKEKFNESENNYHHFGNFHNDFYNDFFTEQERENLPNNLLTKINFLVNKLINKNYFDDIEDELINKLYRLLKKNNFLKHLEYKEDNYE